MKNLLRKLAQRLREEATKQNKQKLVKCAQMTQAMLGLQLLKQKLGGD